jgi:acetolactate synthase-1/2/3 large subunit
MKVSNYIFSTLQSKGIDTVFLVTGGGAMHLNDSIGRIEGLKFICNHHEQASAIAAEGYARVANKPAILNVTTGPGAVNALNGVFGAFTDSIPMIVVSGQVKRETLTSSYNIPGLRQLGDQEVDIVHMVGKITKYAVTVTDPDSIRYHLEKAMYLAVNGRPGPVWLDIPVDVQAAKIDIDQLKGFDPAELTQISNSNLKLDAELVLEKIKSAKRPVIIGSTGVRLAGAIDELQAAIALLGIPVVTAWGHDIIHYDHPQYVGKQGSIGDRAGNFAVQNADLVLIIGSRMPIRQVSYNWENFAPNAYKIQVDIDKAELIKPIATSQLALNYDAKDFLKALIEAEKEQGHKADFNKWLQWCLVRKERYPTVLTHHKDPSKPINPYYFLHEVQQRLTGNDVVVCGNATACIVTFQTSQVKEGQQLFSNSGSASMGYDLPAAIGAAVAAPNKRIICIAGDGSLQMNIQELQTVAQHRWNIKIFVLDNGGYLSIKSTQNSFFGLNIGTNADSGVSFPNFEKIGKAYAIPSVTIEQFDFQSQLENVLSMEGPVVCRVILDVNQLFEPKLSSKQLPDGKMVSASLEDMFPFLSAEELQSNMIKGDEL